MMKAKLINFNEQNFRLHIKLRIKGVKGVWISDEKTPVKFGNQQIYAQHI